jgi:ornithine carbamoyltransferase
MTWINAAAKRPFHLDLARPDGYDPDQQILMRGIARLCRGSLANRLHVQKAVMEILMG